MKRAFRIARVLAAVYGIALAALVLNQRSLLYLPSITSVSPAAAGLGQAKAIMIETADHEHLVAWYIPAAPGKPLLLYFHGNGGGLAERAARFSALTATGDGLLAVSYRGYFGSTGRPSEAGLHLDAEAGYQRALALGYTADRIVLVGESLGSGVAVALAARRPVAGVILDSPYSSILDVAAATYWIFPVRLFLWDQFRSDTLIGQVHAPIFFACGERDWVVPIRFCERLFGLANRPKEIVRVSNAGHLVLGLPDVSAQALRWVDDHARAKTP